MEKIIDNLNDIMDNDKANNFIDFVESIMTNDPLISNCTEYVMSFAVKAVASQFEKPVNSLDETINLMDKKGLVGFIEPLKKYNELYDSFEIYLHHFIPYIPKGESTPILEYSIIMVHGVDDDEIYEHYEITHDECSSQLIIIDASNLNIKSTYIRYYLIRQMIEHYVKYDHLDIYLKPIEDYTNEAIDLVTMIITGWFINVNKLSNTKFICLNTEEIRKSTKMKQLYNALVDYLEQLHGDDVKSIEF